MKEVAQKPCYVSAAHKVYGFSLTQNKQKQKQFFLALETILKRASQLGSQGFFCRKCTNCCQQDKRVLQLFAVEVAYMLQELKEQNIPGTCCEEAKFCPMLTSNNTCLVYQNRPFGCRLFVPWYNWSKDKGCATYPHSKKTLAEIHFLLHKLEQLNREFVVQNGLELDLDFDFLGHWGVSTWFWQNCCSDSLSSGC